MSSDSALDVKATSARRQAYVGRTKEPVSTECHVKRRRRRHGGWGRGGRGGERSVFGERPSAIGERPEGGSWLVAVSDTVPGSLFYDVGADARTWRTARGGARGGRGAAAGWPRTRTAVPPPSELAHLRHGRALVVPGDDRGCRTLVRRAALVSGGLAMEWSTGGCSVSPRRRRAGAGRARARRSAGHSDDQRGRDVAPTRLDRLGGGGSGLVVGVWVGLRVGVGVGWGRSLES